MRHSEDRISETEQLYFKSHQKKSKTTSVNANFEQCITDIGQVSTNKLRSYLDKTSSHDAS